MKRLILLTICIFATLQMFAQQNGDTIIANNPQKVKLRVLYFHAEHRCNTCTSIESTLRKALFDNFQSEIDGGVIDLSIINFESPENAEIAKKYDAYGATMAISPYKNGIELKFEDITGWAFKTVGKPDLFIAQLKEKIITYLK